MVAEGLIFKMGKKKLNAKNYELNRGKPKNYLVLSDFKALFRGLSSPVFALERSLIWTLRRFRFSRSAFFLASSLRCASALGIDFSTIEASN